MNKLLEYHRIGAFLASGLILVSGCKSASVNSGASVSPSLGSPSQMYTPPGDDVYQPQSPTPSPPPAILPMPGYSEPEVPPAPSAQKSRWNRIPSNLKSPFKRSSQSVDQTAANSDSHEGVTRKIKRAWAVKGFRHRGDETVEEVVQPRSSAQAFDASGSEAAESSDSATNEATEVHTPVRSQFGRNRPATAGTRGGQATVEPSLGEALPVPELSNEPSKNDWEEAPKLLPPSP